MKISNVVPYSTNNITPVSRRNTEKTAGVKPNNSSSPAKTPTFLETYMKPSNTFSGRKFDKSGGILYFENAFLNDEPYNGNIILRDENLIINSRYKNGTLASHCITRKDTNDTVFFMEPEFEQNADGGKNIQRKDVTGKYTLFESYDDKGKLCQIEFSKKGRLKENEYTILNTYDEDGYTLLRSETNFYETKDPIKRKIYDYKDGKIARAYLSGKGIVNGNRCCDEYTFYYGDEAKSEEKNVHYYKNPETKEGHYAVSSAKLTLNQGDLREIDFDYQTLDNEADFNPIKRYFYQEHPSTIRTVQSDNSVTFYDSVTEKPYAEELYDEGSDIPKEIRNFETEETAILDSKYSNVAFYSVHDGKDKLKKIIIFQKKEGVYNYRPSWVEHYKNGKIVFTERQ